MRGRDGSWWVLVPAPGAAAAVPGALPRGSHLACAPGLSVLFFCAETVPELDEVPPALWHWSEVAFTAAFTVEYLLRLWSSPEKGPFFRSLMNAVDLFAIAPFYIEVFANIATGERAGARASGGGEERHWSPFDSNRMITPAALRSAPEPRPGHRLLPRGAPHPDLSRVQAQPLQQAPAAVCGHVGQVRTGAPISVAPPTHTYTQCA